MSQLPSPFMRRMVPGKWITSTVLFFIFLNLFSINLIAQNQQQVTGTVSSKGTPLQDVTVTVKGSSASTLTDAQGKFSINAPANGTLAFSYIGKVSLEIKLNGKSSVQVEMEDDNLSLGEVVVVGYNTQKSSRYFEIDKMIELIESAFEKYPNNKVIKFSELTAELARKNGARFLLRGLRNTTDFEYENSISQVNRQLYPDLESVFLITTPKLAWIS